MKKTPFILLALTFVFSNCKKETSCTFVYSSWTSCTNNIQTRTYTSSPSGCTGTPPADSTQRSCVMGKIGNQIWTLTNLDVTTFRNGDAIPQVQDANAWGNLTTGAWCYYANNTANGIIYGKLYNFYAVNDPRGLAPKGYHIPTDEEWSILTTYLGGAVAGGKLKEAGTLHWIDPNTDASNSSNFTGLPGGKRHKDGSFSGIGASGTWWSSSEISATNGAWYCYLYHDRGNIDRSNIYKLYGFSVRCIKD